MLYDFMLLLEKGAFYLAGERMKAPQFFYSIRGKSEVFNEGCRRMGEVPGKLLGGCAAAQIQILQQAQSGGIFLIQLQRKALL